LAAVLVSDHEYPQRVAFTLINKVQTQRVSCTETFAAFLLFDAIHSADSAVEICLSVCVCVCYCFTVAKVIKIL